MKKIEKAVLTSLRQAVAIHKRGDYHAVRRLLRGKYVGWEVYCNNRPFLLSASVEQATGRLATNMHYRRLTKRAADAVCRALNADD